MNGLLIDVTKEACQCVTSLSEELSYCKSTLVETSPLNGSKYISNDQGTIYTDYTLLGQCYLNLNHFCIHSEVFVCFLGLIFKH